jgi:hypothetical protein
MSVVDLSALMRARIKVMLVGPPGLGKTARVNAAAKKAGFAVHVLRAGLADRVDIGGALIPDAAAGVTRELPLESIAALRRADKPTLLFLDDLGQAPMDVQAACMRLFDAGYLPPHVVIWGATNRPEDKAGVVGLCEPLRSRFDVAYTMPLPPRPDTDGKHAPLALCGAVSDWRDELEAWCDWALTTGAAPAVVAWHRATQGRTLYTWQPDRDPAARYADYRSWESVIKLEAAGLASLQNVAAAVGAPVAAEYCALRALGDKLPTIAQIEEAPGDVHVPRDASQLWLLATTLGAALSPANAGALVTYAGRLPRVYCALAMRDGYRRVGAALVKVPAWAAWMRDNQTLLAQS